MLNIKQLTICLFTLILFSVIFVPNSNYAKTTTVSSDEDLRSNIESSTNGDIIKLSTDISLTKPIEITEKEITIDGNGFSISKSSENWTTTGSNASLITAGINAKITLSNITLKNSQKYGAQAYNGGYLVLNGVTAKDNAYGGILVNAGTVEVINLTLGHNGLENSNNGIEIAKGKEISDAENSNQPKLIMNGVLSSNQTTNVIYLATNDDLTKFSVENTSTSKNKIYLSGNKVVVTDENNNIIFESNENNKVQLQGESIANVTLNNKTNNTKKTDKTPKTGSSAGLNIAIVLLILSILSLIILNRKD